MSQVSADGKQITKLRSDTFTDIENLVIWAPDGSGALIGQLDPSGNSTLLWAPADGQPIVELAKDIAANSAQWSAK